MVGDRVVVDEDGVARAKFLTTPRQVGFTADGRQLVVVTMASSNHIEVFQVGPNGRLSVGPVVNTSTTPVPVALTFDRQGHLLVTEAQTSDVSTYLAREDGTVEPIGTATDNQRALCWIAGDRCLFVVSNAARQHHEHPADRGRAASAVVTTAVGARRLKSVWRRTSSSRPAVPGQVGEEGIVAFLHRLPDEQARQGHGYFRV
jgi:hypothetical protein